MANQGLSKYFAKLNMINSKMCYNCCGMEHKKSLKTYVSSCVDKVKYSSSCSSFLEVEDVYKIGELDLVK